MFFIPVDQCRPGMILCRNIYGYESKTRLLMLGAGQVLSNATISQLHKLELPGVYIRNNQDFPKDSHLFISKKRKEELLDTIKEVYSFTPHRSEISLYVQTINKTARVLDQMIGLILEKPEMTLDLTNLKLYDDYTYNHSMEVTVLAIAVGAALKIPCEDLKELALSALLHDIGKQLIPIEILLKPGKLTPEEFSVMKLHSEKGVELLQKAEAVSENILEGILCHHERFDGSGYPNGLSGLDIPLFGRIISCVDVYDALTSKRPYHPPTSPAESIEYLMGGSDKQFDIEIVEAFLMCISPYPVGSCVYLSDKRRAIVVQQIRGKPLRPTLRLVDGPDAPLNLADDPKLQNLTISGLCEDDDQAFNDVNG